MKTGIIVGLAFVLSGCASSPFLISKEESYAPGFVPRNELGEPVLPATRKAEKRKPATDHTANRSSSAHERSSWLTR
ncbi:hypothetical protein [Pedomonas mirosovicensis]|uniref:hypothetical protein n=1 Tax=Pedomonas mirosovicensis TaxID=2908641 RepID=UPI0021686BC3|nr:hypothetical protein [Pedomonas mirosovicensis]MCH8685610.1 hypothetical protein [Pedomonas mirosovicensis]